MASLNKLNQEPVKGEKITWGELKALAENAGVRDEDEIDLIDIAWGRIEDCQCTKDEDFGWQIRL
ncbi:MAG: hypothetical protein OEZ43_16200 [Gammaproteobacteria bacterium]|nr:hypothetical protein [Gammaproteobacteria bacterium]